jgi:hypothetical protein
MASSSYVVNPFMTRKSSNIPEILTMDSANYSKIIFVSDPDKGVCADPAVGGDIFGKGGPDPHSGNRELQLAPDKGRGKT